MAKAKKRVNKGVPVVAVAAGLAAAAAAGYYFYGAKDAPEHRRKASVFARKLQKDVVREAKKLDTISEEALHAIVNQTVRAYRGAKGVDVAELAAVAKELKENWKTVQKEAKGVAKRATPKKRAVKRAS